MPYSAEAEQFFARVTGLTDARKTLYDTYITALVSSGVWAKLHAHHVYSAPNTATAVTNLVNGFYNGVISGSPSFTPDKGFAGTVAGATANYIDTGYNPSVETDNDPTNQHISLWCGVYTASTGYDMGCFDTNTSTSTRIRCRTSTGGFGSTYQVNAISSPFAFTNLADPRGLHLVSTDAAGTALDSYFNAGAGVAGGSIGSPPNVNITVCGSSNNGSVFGGLNQIRSISIGARLTSAQVTAFYNAQSAFLAGIDSPAVSSGVVACRIVGFGISQVIASAALVTTTATLAGVGLSESRQTSAALQSQSSFQLASGVSASVGSSALLSAPGVVVGVALPAVTGTAALAASVATVAGLDTLRLRPDSDIALDGWTDQTGGITNIYQAIDAVSDSDFVRSPPGGGSDLKVRLFSGLSEDSLITISDPSGATQIALTGNQKGAQTFLATGSTISAVRAWLIKVGSPVSNIQAKIFTVDGDHKPLTQVGVASSSVPPSSVAVTLTPYDFLFATPVPVTVGTEYCFVLEADNLSDSGPNHIDYGVKTPSAYADGNWVYFDGASFWSTYITYDIPSVITQSNSVQVAEWVHTNVAETFEIAEQTLTEPQMAAITNFNNLFAELDDNRGNVYRFAISNPPGNVAAPVKVRYRYKKLLAA